MPFDWSLPDIEDQPDGFSDAGEDDRPNVSSYPVDPSGRDSSDVLTLGDGWTLKPVVRIRLDSDLRSVPANGGRQRYNMNDAGRFLRMVCAVTSTAGWRKLAFLARPADGRTGSVSPRYRYDAGREPVLVDNKYANTPPSELSQPV